MVPIPVNIRVQNEAGVEVDQVTIEVPDIPGAFGQHEFKGLKTGTYTCTATLPKEYRFLSENPWKQEVLPGMDGLEVTVYRVGGGSTFSSTEPTPPSPPWIPITGVAAALATALTGSIPAPSITGLFSQVSQPARSTVVSGSNRTTSRNQADDELPQDLKERFKSCLEEGFKNVAAVPGAIESESEESIPDEELPDQLIASYTAIGDVRATIEDCDPTLLLEIAAVDSESSAFAPSTTSNFSQPIVTIIGEDVNVRAEPSLNGAVIGQVSGGEIQVDLVTLNLLSPVDRRLIEAGEGWIPVVLADGRKGFIYSAYVDALQGCCT